MKHKLLLFPISLMMAVSAHLSAENITVDGIKYSTSGTTATVTGYTYSIPEDVIIPESITYNGDTYSVTNIGDQAFRYCPTTSITIPQSITSIGLGCFYSCTGKLIINCNIGSASNYLYGWFFGSYFSSIEIGEGVTTIGDYAFSSCYRLTSITIPNSVTSIGSGAFNNCQNLTSISIPNNISSIGDLAFSYCQSLTSISIPNNISSIGNGVFSGCDGLVSITVEEGNSVYDSRNNCNAIIETETNTLIAGCKNSIIPNSVTHIGDRVFSSFDSLNITLSNNITSIGDYAFSNCNFTNLTLPNSITSVGDYAFSYCNFTNLTLPNSITSVGDEAFYACTGNLIVHCNIGDGTSSGGWFYGSDFSSIEIVEGVTSIGPYAFQNCESLTSITIPNSVTSIGGCVFIGCSELVSITVEEGNTVYDSRNNCNAIIHSRYNDLIAGCKTTIIPNSVTSIRSFAFEYCDSLSSITIPNSVTKIGGMAFRGCNNLLSITCLADTPPTVGAYCFYDVDKSLCTLYVKKNTTSLYASADGWSDFINIVEIEDQYTGLDQIQADPETESVYDLTGNRVQQLQKGRTYIRNGKKILVK